MGVLGCPWVFWVPCPGRGVSGCPWAFWGPCPGRDVSGCPWVFRGVHGCFGVRAQSPGVAGCPCPVCGCSRLRAQPLTLPGCPRSVVRAVEDVGVRGPRQEPGDGAEARVGVRDAGARGAPGAAGAGGAGADPGGRRDPRAVRAAALRDPPGPPRRRGALPGAQGAQGAAQGDGEGAEEAQPAARGGVGGPPGAPRGRRRPPRRRPGAGRGAGAAVPHLPGRDAGAAHAGALPALVLRGVHRAGAAGALRLPRVRPLLRAAGGQPAPRRPHAGDPRRRAAPARLRGLRHHHHPVRLPARRAGGGAPEPGRAVPGHHESGIPARLPRGEQGAGAVPQGLRPAPHLHCGHLADHRPCQRHHLERHPPQDQLHRRAPAVRVPRPHVPRPGAGGAAGQGHHRGLSGGAGTPPGQGEPPMHRDPPRIPPGSKDPPGPSLGSGTSPDSRNPPGRGIPPYDGTPPGQGDHPPGQRDPPIQWDPPCRGIPPDSRTTPEQGKPPGPPGWQWGTQGGGQAPPGGVVPRSPPSTDRRTPVHSPDPQDRWGDPCPLPPQPRGGPTLGGCYLFFISPAGL